MKFQVPQFIEVEDKIFGPFTFKQFLYLAGGVGISFILYKALPLFVAALVIIPVAGLSLALAFYKINNKPFVGILESGFRYLLQKKLYIWKKEDKKIQRAAQAQYTDPLIAVPKLSESKLKDIAWSLDVHESIYSGEKRSREDRAKEKEKEYFKL
ncbi:MAG: PrgI family protein [Parcubacteria group bacterium]|nr:PrgI family protein [Parcubacteria group bacterium]